MRRHLWSIREAIVEAPDSLCLERARLITEAYRRHEGEPVPLQRAQALIEVMAGLSLDLQSNPFFAGNTSCRPHAWMLLPEFGIGVDAQIAIENEGLAHVIEQPLPTDIIDYWRGRALGGIQHAGHIALDLRQLIEKGLAGVLAELDAHADEGGPEQRQMRQAMRIVLQGMAAWAGRYAGAAAGQAGRETEKWRRVALRRMAAACSRVPLHPPRDLFEALQAILLVHFGAMLEGHCMSLSVGCLDRILAPFAAEAEDESATVLFAAFLLKLNTNPLCGRGSKGQAITVGGLDASGRDCCNPITRRLLEASDFIRLADPHVFLRWHAKMDPHVRRQAVDMLARGLSMPLLVADESTVRGLIASGVKPSDAWEYAIIGCNELAIPGLLHTSALPVGSLNYLECLAEAMLAEPAPNTLEELLDRTERTIERNLETSVQARLQNGTEVDRRLPSPFTSSLMRGHAAAGCHVREGQAYRLYGQYERGLANAVNGFAALEACCRPEQGWTLATVVGAMRQNFAGEYETVRTALLAAPKWGNDDDRADIWAERLVECRRRAMRRVGRRLGTGEHLACHVVRSLHYTDGRKIGATPDGRLAEEPVGDSLGAVCGTAIAGPTAILNSVLKINTAEAYRGGTNLNLTLTANSARQHALTALIEAFFAAGGQELQINVLSAAQLREAQRHPERHRDLVVRVAGLNAIFIKLSRLQQDELIRRAEHAAGAAGG